MVDVSKNPAEAEPPPTDPVTEHLLDRVLSALRRIQSEETDDPGNNQPS